jgi:putative copper export protein
MMFDADLLTISFRACIYVATIAVAGSQFVMWTLPQLQDDGVGTVHRQMRLGIVLLLLVEPIRIAMFQLAVSGGDAALAISPSFLAIAIDMGPQQASAVRVITALIVLAFFDRAKWVVRIASLAMIGSYALEGHTASEDFRILYAGLLLLHLVIVHWWLAALYPLAVRARVVNADSFATLVDRFSLIAMVSVPVLILAGAVLLALLIEWRVDLMNSYQFRFAVKVALVACILAIAARNKFWITPELTQEPTVGAKLMRRSIAVEVVVGLTILLATAWVLRTGPDHTQNHATIGDQLPFSRSM